METIINLLPFLLLLICPISMIFMHKGHGNSDPELIKVRSQVNESQKELSSIKKKIVI